MGWWNKRSQARATRARTTLLSRQYLMAVASSLPRFTTVPVQFFSSPLLHDSLHPSVYLRVIAEYKISNLVAPRLSRDPRWKKRKSSFSSTVCNAPHRVVYMHIHTYTDRGISPSIVWRARETAFEIHDPGAVGRVARPEVCVTPICVHASLPLSLHLSLRIDAWVVIRAQNRRGIATG